MMDLIYETRATVLAQCGKTKDLLSRESNLQRNLGLRAFVSRDFCVIIVGVNFRNFHTVSAY